MRLFNIALAAAVAGVFGVVLYSDEAASRARATVYRSFPLQLPALVRGGSCTVTCVGEPTLAASTGGRASTAAPATGAR